MNKTRRNFDSSYKLAVVKMIKEQGLSLKQVCADQNLVASCVREWVKRFEAELGRV